MVSLHELSAFCDERTRRKHIPDFPPAYNGLQVANPGTVSKIGAAVDAGKVPFAKAIALGVDFLIVHHGLYWTAPTPLTGTAYEKVKLLMDANCALYSSHLPLDCHPELGNNALLAKALGLEVERGFVDYEKVPMGVIAQYGRSRDTLREQLSALFPTVTAIEYGSKEIERVGILTGSGASAVSELRRAGIDTLITGELRQQHFNQAQEEGLNLYLCGHYATETFGVKALAAEVAARFGLPWVFIETECPL
ncbi:MAG: Nif3-like dinuclear metal center hexameric protein [Verrucomicrobiota bacterium]|nr:Nif3-like dinuclear metal center hexameric protein [Verrucomicrobiota bacterium]